MVDRIDNRAMLTMVVGVLVVAGIGLTAGALPHAASLDATENLPQPPEGGDDRLENPRENPREFNGSGPDDSTPDDDDRGPPVVTRCVEFLASTPGTLLVVLGFLGIVGLVYRRFSFSAAVLTGWTVTPPIALAYFMLTNCGGGGGPDGGDGLPTLPATDVAIETAPNVPPWAVVGVVGVVFAAAVGLLYRSVGEREPVEPEADEGTETDPELDAFAEAAGRAADRIERHDVDVDNAVYEAWVEMTSLLAVEEPDVYSPGEFADTAIQLGMNEDDVMELTRLFNEVRYGDKEISTREARAVAVLRDIESAYGRGNTEKEGR